MVFMGIAQQDPMRAFDLAITIESPAEQMQALQSVVRLPGDASGDADSRADRGQDHDACRTAPIDARCCRWWRRAGALKTRKRRPSGCSPTASKSARTLFGRSPQRFGQQDPAGAAAYLDRVPAEARTDWMTMVAIGYSQTDPEGGPELDQAVPGPGRVRSRRRCDRFKRSAIQPACRRRVPGHGRSLPRRTLPQQWSMSPTNGRRPTRMQRPIGRSSSTMRPSRANALTGIAQAWGSYDPRAARSWALSLPSGANRDSALLGAVSSIGATESVDQTLLGAFSNDRHAPARRDESRFLGCAARFRRGAPHDRGLHQRSGHAPAGRADARPTPGRSRDDQLGARDTFRTVSGRRAAVHRAVPCPPPAIPCVRRSTAPAARTASLTRAHATGHG